ncbi:Kunitz/Bovine pancreatic trypsin inhibitor domain protein [Oesophagostomum dentatum]|uniref:Kunitz/Bovine pancreatic trypsin inhibitor domain protein n=1 Tax=Oesophagostomum dentatum TaxID=61180 RepID=A0A0B1S8X0_OESDE|nr:Kunitz/Bovine pancreatic trypsin inhibitor domain protein [Oesophagostomum dentatum]
MDAETLTCLAFKYTGCGGNGNNFKSRTHCQLRCIPMDFINCPANTPAVKREDGTSHCDSEHKCPEGSSCVEGFIFGKCCDNEASEKYIADRRPNCGNRQAVKDENRDYPITLLGKSCEHNFCPEGADCHKGNFYAYCCK